jgi:hypothetical protein
MAGADEEARMDAYEDAELVDRASVAGWTLVQRETDLGQLVWAWRPAAGSSPCPEFLTRREAVEFMRLLDLRPESRSNGSSGSPGRHEGSTEALPRRRRTDSDPDDERR